jgi:hypothetical protein
MISNPSSKDASSARSKAARQFASTALRSGDRVKAQMLLRDRLAEDPMDANAMSVLAQIAVDDRRIEDATVLLRRAVSADPRPERRLALIEHLQRHAGPALALREFEVLPGASRSKFEVSGMEAKTLGLLGNRGRQHSRRPRVSRSPFHIRAAGCGPFGSAPSTASDRPPPRARTEAVWHRKQ